jgi:hypothetical protein
MNSKKAFVDQYVGIVTRLLMYDQKYILIIINYYGFLLTGPK